MTAIKFSKYSSQSLPEEPATISALPTPRPRRQSSQDPLDKYRSLRIRSSETDKARFAAMVSSLERGSVGTTVEPFGVFPVQIDREFCALFDTYRPVWDMGHSKATFFAEVTSHPSLYHSFLTRAASLRQEDQLRALWHETRAMEVIRVEVAAFRDLPDHFKPHAAYTLTWAITCLATEALLRGHLDGSLAHVKALANIAEMADAADGRFLSYVRIFRYHTMIVSLLSMSPSKAIECALSRLVTRSALQDAEFVGFRVPENSLASDLAVKDLLLPYLWDALQALAAICDPSQPKRGSSDSARSLHMQAQSLQALKIALRLASHGPLNHNEDILQECVRATMLMYLWSLGRRQLPGTTGTSPWGRSSSPTAAARALAGCQHFNERHLTPALLRQAIEASSCSKAVSDLLIWMLIVNGSTMCDQLVRRHYSDVVQAIFPILRRYSFTQIQHWDSRMPWDQMYRFSTVEVFRALLQRSPLLDS